MDTVINKLKRMSIDEFADEHGLQMSISERNKKSYTGVDFASNRWYASFINCEVLRGSFLVGTHGIGATPQAAIDDYAIQISGEQLVVNAYREDRREITVPILSED